MMLLLQAEACVAWSAPLKGRKGKNFASSEDRRRFDLKVPGGCTSDLEDAMWRKFY